MQPWFSLAILAMAPLTGTHTRQNGAPVRICLVRAAVEGGNNGQAAADAIRASFTAFLTGPSLTSQALQAPLASQAREEAKVAGCPFVLLTNVKLVSRRSGGGLLGKVAAGAVRQGAVEAGVGGGSATARIAGSAASGAIQQATQDFATTTRNKDEVTLGFRLETADGTVLVEKKEKRSASSDGEDLITPLVQSASEKIVEATRRKGDAELTGSPWRAP